MAANVWGTDPDDIDADAFCPDCERENAPSGARQHYSNCPQHPSNRKA